MQIEHKTKWKGSSKNTSNLLCILLSLLYIFSTLLTPLPASAGVYENCVYAWEFGDTTRVSMVIYPIGKQCYNLCQGEDGSSGCMKYSRSGYDGELNDDVMDQCRSKCQGGDNFSSPYREASDNPPPFSLSRYVWKDAISLDTTCSKDPKSPASAAYNFYDTGVAIDPSNPAEIKLILLGRNSPIKNQVYMCGFKSVSIYPDFYSLSSLSWQAHSAQGWNARNYRWTDTDIKAQDGDYLALTYGGPYINNCDEYGCYYDSTADNLLMSTGKGENMVVPGGALYTMTQPSCDPHASAAELDACLQSSASASESPGAIVNHNESIEFLGLKGWASNVTVPSNIESIPGSKSYKVTSFFGTLAGLGSAPTPLLIRHYDVGGDSNWDNNMGGKYVKMKWRGCPRRGGEGLQYAVVPPEPGSTAEDKVYVPRASSSWTNVPIKVLQGIDSLNFDSNQEGRLFFRIEPVGVFGSSGSNDASQAIGQYYLELSVMHHGSGRLAGLLDTLIKDISGYFFGDNGQQGIAQEIFNELVKDSAFAQAIRALLIFYIAYTGLSFMIGTAHFSQQEALVRIMKIAIVLTLISGQGWWFFNTYLFTLFTKGVLDIIGMTFIDPTIDPTVLLELKQGNMYAVFSNLDRPISQMLFGAAGSGIKGTGLLGGPTWIKIQALMFSTVFGFLLAIVVIVGCIFYAMAIFKAVMVYLVSLIGIAVMMMTAPIFISFLLFAKTREMFDSWIKLFISFAFQPILVFTMLGIMSKLLLAMFYMTLWFTVCEACLLKILDWCIINGYVTMYSAASGVGFLSSPISSAAVAIGFLLVAIGSYAMIDVMTSLATQLISGAFFGVHLGHLATQANPFTKGAEALEAITGSSQQGQVKKQREKIIRQAHKEAKKR